MTTPAKQPEWITKLDAFAAKFPEPIHSAIVIVLLVLIIYSPWASFWMLITWDWTWIFSGWSRVSLGVLGLLFTYILIFDGFESEKK